MNFFSLRTLIDDILLLVRNNNISESEDLSRSLIASWILSYRAQFLKKLKDQEKTSGVNNGDDTSLNEFLEMREYDLKLDESLDNTHLFRRETIEEITGLLDNDPSNIYSVADQEGHIIQFMNEFRKHYHRFRKYTGGELTYWYENKKIHILGYEDDEKLSHIFVTALFTNDNSSDEDVDEDNVKIPGWMIPQIKEAILKNELAFMLNRISDDSNNSSLDGIKPQNQSVIPNEK